MDKRIISLAAHEKTKICVPALEAQDDPQLLPHRIERIYDLAGAHKEDVFVFTSSGAESVNQVLFSVFLKVARITGKCHFVTSAIEDAPTLQMMKRLEELGCFVKIAPVNQKGEIDTQALSALLSPRTALISLTMAQGLTGVIQPVEEIAKIAKEKGILLHLEGTYAMGRYYFSFQDLGADYLTFSGDRLHSVIGSGGLFAKKHAPLEPLILGGKDFRGGALDTSSLLALCAAAAQASLFLDAMSLEVARLRDAFEKEILKKIPDAHIFFKDALRLPNTTVIAFPKVHQEALHHLLQRKGLETLIGGSYSQHLASLLPFSDQASCALSFSLSRMTTEEDLSLAATLIEESVQSLRKLSEEMTYFLPTKLNPPASFGKKLREKMDRFLFGGIFTPEEAAQKGMLLVIGKESNIHLYFLVDPTDGIIADVKFQAFGPPLLLAAAEIASELILRKNYMQASRLSSDLLDQHVRDKKDTPAFPHHAHTFLNQVISAIDAAISFCKDIPCSSNDYDTTPILWDASDNPNGIDGWEQFPLEKKHHLIEEVIEKEIRPYVEMDAGGVKVIEVKETNEVLISYEGSCTTCHSATGSTLTAIQQILKARLHPTITVIPQL